MWRGLPDYPSVLPKGDPVSAAQEWKGQGDQQSQPTFC